MSWSCYCELLKIEESLERSFYEQEAIQNIWSVRELKRQINSMLFNLIALGKDKKIVIKMAGRGQIGDRFVSLRWQGRTTGSPYPLNKKSQVIGTPG